jgi:heat-inducible transcriptional repressor
MERASKRTQQVLHAVLRLHIETGRPVGSHAVARRLSDEWSSATIRAELASLCEAGLLSQPHTSAGRVPTASAYRAYARSVLRSRGFDATSDGAVDVRDTGEVELSRWMRRVSSLLACSSRFAGVVVNASPSRAEVDHLEFVYVRPTLVIAVIVTRPGAVVHRRIDLDASVSRWDLEHFNNYVNQHLRGLTVQQMRTRIERELERDQARADALAMAALGLAAKALDASTDETDVFIEGKEQLIALSDFESLDRLRSLLRAMEQKEGWLALLDASLAESGLRVFIGDESPVAQAADCALITAPYGVQSAELGRVGILGPMRMDYQRMIPLVEQAARLVSSHLSTQMDVH